MRLKQKLIKFQIDFYRNGEVSVYL